MKLIQLIPEKRGKVCPKRAQKLVNDCSWQEVPVNIVRARKLYSKALLLPVLISQKHVKADPLWRHGEGIIRTGGTD